MAAPRVFVSSTCHDLHEVRSNLRQFIESFGFEPVMSDYGDVFYPHDQHVQDGCLHEIESCQMMVLVVGNNYGTIYHGTDKRREHPESVTLKEFQKALSVAIPKYAFLNKFLHHDYTNYRKFLDAALAEHFGKTDVPPERVDEVTRQVRGEFDSGYHFPQSHYRYGFHFLDIIVRQTTNNAIFPFEEFAEIQEQLRKQWAGYVYEQLTTGKTVPSRALEEVASSLARIEQLVTGILKIGTKADMPQALDVSRLAGNLAMNSLATAQQALSDCMYVILFDELRGARCEIEPPLDEARMSKWLESLGPLLRKYKWSKTIPARLLWADFVWLAYTNWEEIPYEAILKLYGLYQNIPQADRASFAASAMLMAKKIVKVGVTKPDDTAPF
jgi:hypothetical protein